LQDPKSKKAATSRWFWAGWKSFFCDQRRYKPAQQLGKISPRREKIRRVKKSPDAKSKPLSAFHRRRPGTGQPSRMKKNERMEME
jgi:hypothetical protein